MIYRAAIVEASTNLIISGSITPTEKKTETKT